MKAKLDRLCQRFPAFGWVMRIQNRYSELNGNYLAAAVTLAGFLSLFPLLLVAFAILGFFAVGRVDLAGDIIGRLGLSGEAATFVQELVEQTEKSRQVASVIGIIGLLWSGLGLVAAVQYALNQVWQVKGNGWKDKLTGLAWLAGAGLLFVASFGATAAAGLLPSFLAPVGLILGLAIDIVLWLWTFKILTNRSLAWKAYLPGAIAGAVGFTLLKAVGGIYVPRLVASASALYGSFAVIFAMLAWLLFFGRLVVYAGVTNVVLWEARHGTVTIDVPVPRVPGEVPVEGTRSGEAMPATA